MLGNSLCDLLVTLELTSRNIYEGLKKEGYKCDLDIWMKEPEWAKVNVLLDGMTWTIEGIDEVGTTKSAESEFKKSDESEFNLQANAGESKYIHFQIDRVFKKGQDAIAQLAIKRLCSSFIYHERANVVSMDGSFAISFHRQYPLLTDDDEAGIKTIIDQLNNFKIIVQSVFYSVQEEKQ